MEVWRSKIHSINKSVCPGAGHLSSFFCPGARGGGGVNIFGKSGSENYGNNSITKF